MAVDRPRASWTGYHGAHRRHPSVSAVPSSEFADVRVALCVLPLALDTGGAHLLLDLARRPDWIGGVVAGLVGLRVHVVAPSLGELAAFQPLLVLEMPLAVLGMSRLFGISLSRRDWVAVGLLTLARSMHRAAPAHQGLQTHDLYATGPGRRAPRSSRARVPQGSLVARREAYARPQHDAGAVRMNPDPGESLPAGAWHQSWHEQVRSRGCPEVEETAYVRR